jgi:hypothetical protein
MKGILYEQNPECAGAQPGSFARYIGRSAA